MSLCIGVNYVIFSCELLITAKFNVYLIFFSTFDPVIYFQKKTFNPLPFNLLPNILNRTIFNYDILYYIYPNILDPWAPGYKIFACSI